MKKSTIGLIVLLFCMACAPKAKFISTGYPYPRYPRYFGTVRVFLSPPGELIYKEIGFVVGSGKLLDSWTDIIERMQKTAGIYGANGIILIDHETAINAKKIFPIVEHPKDSFGNPLPTKVKELYAIAIQIRP